MPPGSPPVPRSGPPAVSAAARALAARCESRVNELARRMARDAFERLPGYPDLPADVKDVEIAATVRNGLRLFLRRVRDSQSRPGDYSLFRERAAQRAEEGMPLHTLLRSHSMGVYVLWQALRDEARSGEEEALIELVDFLLRGHEAIVGAVAETYLDERAALFAERREHHRSLVRGLLDGSLPPLRAFEELGLHGPSLVLHLHLPQGPDPAASAVAVRRRIRRVQMALDRTFDTEVVCLLGVGGGDAIVPRRADDLTGQHRCEELSSRLRQVCGSDVRLAAVAAETAADVPAAARTAAEVVRVARACGRPAGPHRMEDVLLEYHLSRRDESSDRIAALLDPIGDRPELLRTLRVYLEHRQDRRVSARHLELHPNTVDNRLTRITELTGLDLASPRGTALALAALLLRGDAPTP
ncbi:helix-turn-helix domain-containing protein [Streptomyces sp. NBC_01433]|uniref:PucR family transcriptional regulator n=1 Tax=Streptomyces sp. NBC_01433 TaxID=2903864 RepID=UPI00224DF405|nr:helix-turn-helix domain-containing protein [Streptomyces sp. NBC_01433]MCX4678464.1 helix-turn-helix domain-containing protein [Streptomyces sp. NBC_01433]